MITPSGRFQPEKKSQRIPRARSDWTSTLICHLNSSLHVHDVLPPFDLESSLECRNDVRSGALFYSLVAWLTHLKSLTGLLSFMLSDEITTGAINTTMVDKVAFASKSHAFNLSNKKFKVRPSFDCHAFSYARTLTFPPSSYRTGDVPRLLHPAAQACPRHGRSPDPLRTWVERSPRRVEIGQHAVFLLIVVAYALSSFSRPI